MRAKRSVIPTKSVESVESMKSLLNRQVKKQGAQGSPLLLGLIDGLVDGRVVLFGVAVPLADRTGDGDDATVGGDEFVPLEGGGHRTFGADIVAGDSLDVSEVDVPDGVVLFLRHSATLGEAEVVVEPAIGGLDGDEGITFALIHHDFRVLRTEDTEETGGVEFFSGLVDFGVVSTLLGEFEEESVTDGFKKTDFERFFFHCCDFYWNKQNWAYYIGGPIPR